ncbi:MAG TPA: glycosyltransferase family 39 protein [Candidatus Dormibacteraeota bacterium]|nr:glycosyltransferase family 39 protein [Candidatus Dormibacteraeota bacterium]
MGARWSRPAALAIAAGAAALFAWNVGASDFAPYYSGAARSMSESWSAFLFGSFDPAGSITVDKAPGFLWPQALAARIFGFHAWALALPQVVEGVVAVLALEAAVRRWAGPAAGLLAAATFALTPVVASMFGKTMEDGLLTMCLVLAAASWQRAVDGARLGPLLLAGFWVGAGFQAKMLAAWVVLPALAVYGLVAPTTPRRRLGHLALAGAVVLAASAWWTLLVALTPADARPYVDATTSNDVLGMVLGYNGADRFGVSGLGGAIAVDFGPLPAVATSPFKLLDGHLATQVGWLYPLALLALGMGLWERRGRDRTDRVRSGLLLWGVWLATAAAVFSAGVVLHTSYMATLAPPLAALSAFGVVRLVQRRSTGELAAAVVATLAWAVWLAWPYRWFLPWLAPAAIVAGALGLALLAAARSGGRERGRLAAAGLACAAASMLASPAAWAASSLDPAFDGSVLDASAGPSGIFDLVAPAVAAASRARLERVPGGGAAIGQGPPTRPQLDVLASLQAHRRGARYLVATRSVSVATVYVRETGLPVLLVGGFSGRAPYPTVAAFRALVAAGQLRSVLVPPSANDGIDTWVRATCTPVALDPADVAAVSGQLYACDVRNDAEPIATQ